MTMPHLPSSTLFYAAFLLTLSWVVSFASTTAGEASPEPVRQEVVANDANAQRAVDSQQLLAATCRLVFFIGH